MNKALGNDAKCWMLAEKMYNMRRDKRAYVTGRRLASWQDVNKYVRMMFYDWAKLAIMAMEELEIE